jgi:hypothetical protein
MDDRGGVGGGRRVISVKDPVKRFNAQKPEEDQPLANCQNGKLPLVVLDPPHTPPVRGDLAVSDAASPERGSEQLAFFGQQRREETKPQLPGATFDHPLVAVLQREYPDIENPQRFVRDMSAAFPELNLLREALVAIDWERENLKCRRKRRHQAFLRNWFSRTEERRAVREHFQPQPIARIKLRRVVGRDPETGRILYADER